MVCDVFKSYSKFSFFYCELSPDAVQVISLSVCGFVFVQNGSLLVIFFKSPHFSPIQILFRSTAKTTSDFFISLENAV